MATTTTTTTVPAGFPAVVMQAMAQFTPFPAGAQAPIRLPPVSGYVTAETGGLGGQANVTLIVTPSPVPVDSPSLSSTAAGRELASFSTTSTASAAAAQGELAGDRSQSLASCQGASSPLTLGDGTKAASCPTVEGSAIDWDIGNWALQVLALDGSTPPIGEADHIDTLVAGGASGNAPTGGLPVGDTGGIASVVVPGSSSAGSADTAAIEWTVGADVFQVRSSDDPDSAFAVAAAMRPFPG